MIQTDDPEEKGVELVHGAEVYRLRGELLPLLRLNTICACHHTNLRLQKISILLSCLPAIHDMASLLMKWVIRKKLS